MSNDKNTHNLPSLDEFRAATGESLKPGNRGEIVDSFQENLEALENLSPVVRTRVGVLRLIQCKQNEYEASFFEEKAALEAKYQKLYEPLYKRRCEMVNGDTEVDAARCANLNGATKVDGVSSYSTTEEEVKGVPGFWLGAMKNNRILAEEISKRDEGGLKFLKDIKYSKLDDPKGFKLDFYFDTNPYFKNSVLTKVYHMIDEVERVVRKAIGTEIEWLRRKCLTQKIIKKKLKKGSKTAKPITKIEACESFFKYFNPPQIHGNEDATEEFQCQIENDYVIGETIRDHLIPHAVSWYTGEAADVDDFKDLEDDDEEMLLVVVMKMPKMKTKIVKKKGGIVPTENGQQGGQPPECKQQ